MSNMTTSVAFNGTFFCQTRKDVTSRGVFFGDNPFDFAAPVLYAQLTLSALLTSFLQLILTPLGETAFISQMLVGIALGPSFLGKDSTIRHLIFPEKSFYITKTFAFLGSMLFMFLVGVKMDLGMVKKSGKKAVVIGLCAFFLPLMLNTTFAFILKSTITMEHDLHESLISIAIFQSSSSFHVIACLLADLKLLNSELGRLAVSSSMVSGICSWFWLIIAFMWRQSSINKHESLHLMVFGLGGMLFFIICILRPIFLWMVGQTAKRKAITESYMFSVFVMVLMCALFGEVIGQHFMLGPMILGLAVPDGWPLGSALVDKLDSYVSSILLPSYFVYSCSGIDLTLIHMKTAGIVEILALCSIFGKVTGTMLPSLYCKMPVIDSLSLGLIMSTHGITDILTFQHGRLLHFIDQKSLNILLISVVLTTGTITPIVKLLYKPSKRYMSFRRWRTVQHTTPNAELRLLACIFHQDSTPSVINLLDLCNPKPKTPICFYVVHLIKLLGRSAPLLVAHKQGKRNSSHSNHSDHIIKAFQLYEQHNRGKLMVHAFTAIAPYASMHHEICTLALEKRASMVIVPFHKQWTLHGVEESANPIRTVNFKILDKAPCSVGILVDKGTLNGGAPGRSKPLYCVAVIFVGGPDDREALSCAMRMVEHPNVGLTVIQLVESNGNGKNLVSKKLDCDMINQFKMANIQKKHHSHREEVVKDSVEMINVIRSLENLYDLILVGRRHDSNSPLFGGLTLWNDFPELGFLGDMLVSSGSNWYESVFVVQQHTFEGEDMPEGFKLLMEGSYSVNASNMRNNTKKLWPISQNTN